MDARGRVRRSRRAAWKALRGLRAALGGDDHAVPRASRSDVVSRAQERDALELRVLEALAAVRDPEIPPVSITDLGIVERVRVSEAAVEIDLLPTFAGCPALD